MSGESLSRGFSSKWRILELAIHISEFDPLDFHQPATHCVASDQKPKFKLNSISLEIVVENDWKSSWISRKKMLSYFNMLKIECQALVCHNISTKKEDTEIKLTLTSPIYNQKSFFVFWNKIRSVICLHRSSVRIAAITFAA